MSLAVSASDSEAWAATADEPVKTAVPTLASATPRSATIATNTVRVLSVGIARPLLSMVTDHGMPSHTPDRDPEHVDVTEKKLIHPRILTDGRPGVRPTACLCQRSGVTSVARDLVVFDDVTSGRGRTVVRGYLGEFLYRRHGAQIFLVERFDDRCS